MYFYVLDGGSYEEYYKTVFYSKTKYSHEQFMDLIKKAYEHRCNEIINEYDISKRCDFFLRVSMVLWSKQFNEYLEKISDLKAIEGDEKIFVGTCTTPNRNTNEINKCLRNLNIPDCRDICSEDNKRLKELNCCFEDYYVEL